MSERTAGRVAGAKTARWELRPAYIEEHRDGCGKDGVKLLNKPDGLARRGQSGDKLRRKAFERKL